MVQNMESTGVWICIMELRYNAAIQLHKCSCGETSIEQPQHLVSIFLPKSARSSNIIVYFHIAKS